MTDDGGAFVHGAPANGLNFQESSDGVIAFPGSGEVGKATGLTNGTLGWFRFCANPDDTGLASTTLPRIDMSIADATLGTTAVVVDKIYYINSGSFTFPYQYGV